MLLNDSSSGEEAENQDDRAQSLLWIAASAEYSSEHPIAKSIVGKAQETNWSPELAETENFRNLPGKGVVCEVDGKAVILGNRKLIEEEGVGLTEHSVKAIEHLENNGKTVVVLVVDEVVVAVWALTDTGKEFALFFRVCNTFVNGIELQ